MGGKRFTEEQIIGVLKESEAGSPTGELCRRHGIGRQTFFRWRSKHIVARAALLIVKGMLAGFLAALPAPALVAQEDNGIGIYFDDAAMTNCLSAAPGTPTTAYLVATGLSTSAGGVSGFECTLLYDSSEVPGGVEVTLPAAGINVEAPPVYRVAFSSPLPQATAITLLMMSFVCSDGPVLLGVGSAAPCSYEWPCMSVAAGNNPANIIWLTPSSTVGYPDSSSGFLVAGVNAGPGCPVVAGAGSWGAVKSLYGGE